MKRHHPLRLLSLLLLLGLLTSCYSSKTVTRERHQPLRKHESISRVNTIDNKEIVFLTATNDNLGAVMERDTLFGITEDYRFIKIPYAEVQSLRRFDPQIANTNAIITASLKNGKSFTFLTKNVNQGAILKEDMVVGFSRKGIPMAVPWEDVKSYRKRFPDDYLTVGAALLGTITGIVVIGVGIIAAIWSSY